MQAQLTMVYWRGEQFFLGKLLDHPEIMTQGETLEASSNLKKTSRMRTWQWCLKMYRTTIKQKNLLCEAHGILCELVSRVAHFTGTVPGMIFTSTLRLGRSTGFCHSNR